MNMGFNVRNIAGALKVTRQVKRTHGDSIACRVVSNSRKIDLEEVFQVNQD